MLSPMPQTLPQALTLDNPFWHFSCQVWSEENSLKQSLLRAQTQGIAINLLLFAAWTSREALDASGWCNKKWQHWHHQHTRRIRALRETYPSSSVCAALYQHLLDAELSAEQIEQALLFASAQHFKPHALQGQALLQHNLHALLTRCQQNPATLETALIDELYAATVRSVR